MNEFEHVRGDKAGASGVGPMWMGRPGIWLGGP